MRFIVTFENKWTTSSQDCKKLSLHFLRSFLTYQAETSDLALKLYEDDFSCVQAWKSCD
jgi:hypothetical protein